MIFRSMLLRKPRTLYAAVPEYEAKLNRGVLESHFVNIRSGGTDSFKRDGLQRTRLLLESFFYFNRGIERRPAVSVIHSVGDLLPDRSGRELPMTLRHCHRPKIPNARPQLS